MNRTSETIGALRASLHGRAAPSPGDNALWRGRSRVAAHHVARGVLWLLLVLLAAQVALAIGTEPALAQGVEGGNADNIAQTGENIFDWLAEIILICCGIGFLVCFTLMAIGSSNERLQARYKSGAVGCAGACIAALLVPDLIALMQQWTGA